MRITTRRRRFTLWHAVAAFLVGWVTFSMLFTMIAQSDTKENIQEHRVKQNPPENLKNNGDNNEGNRRGDADNSNAVSQRPILSMEPGYEPLWKRELQQRHNIKGDNVMAIPHNVDSLGEMGRPVVLEKLNKEQSELREKLWKRHYLDEYVSDKISLHRSLPDVRPPGCKEFKYPIEKMPQASVIVCFHNEAFSTLLRTVHSILNRSPPQLLKEIILVDDYSDHEAMGKQLEEYILHLKKVKLVRCAKREGLIRGRLLGAKHATAPILIFLDSHSECTDGWLEPLVYRMFENETNVVVPVIDVIHDRTLQFMGSAYSMVNVGGFDWNLIFNWHAPPVRDLKMRKNSWDPIRSPTMAGGLFGITKSFFEYLGTYDSGMDFWGGENLELSFKTWLCGGNLETLPCSHVGHIFRSNSPHKWHEANAVRKNCIRLALVWLDDYKKYYFQRIGEANVKPENYGDISQRLELKKRLKCKPFDYFVKNIWPDIFIPSEAVASGEIRNGARGNRTCLDIINPRGGQTVGLYPCHGMSGNQFFMYTKTGEIRHDDYCLDHRGGASKDIIVDSCHNSYGNQAWYYDNDRHMIYHNVTQLCLEANTSMTGVLMSKCDDINVQQHWYFEKYNASILTATTTQNTATNTE